jgi:hypothetical protein
VASNQVSGPGPMSKRTDIGDVQKTQDLPNADYGEQQAYQAQQSGAPLAADSGQAPASAGGGAPSAPVVPMGAATNNPGEPVTSGAASGPGPGLASLGLPNQPGQDMAKLQGYLPVLNFMGTQPNASWAIRNLVRDVKAAGSAGTT